MAPDVLLRKLTYLRKLLEDLSPYKNASFAQVEAEHYKLERLLELMVMAATDILNHLLAERGKTAVSYKSAFQLANQEGMIPAELSDRLQNAASMRNVLVHMVRGDRLRNLAPEHSYCPGRFRPICGHLCR